MTQWIYLDGALVSFERLLHPSQIEQGVPAIRPRRAAAQRLRAAKALDGLLEAALFVKQNALHVDRLVLIGLVLQSLLKPLPGSGSSSEARKWHQEIERLHLGRVERECLAQISPLPKAAPAARARAARLIQPETRSGRSSMARRSAAQASVSRPCSREEPSHPRGGKIRPLGKRPPVTHLGFADAAVRSRTKPEANSASGEYRTVRRA